MTAIYFLNALFPPQGHGGAENYVLRTAKALQDRGNDVGVITTKPYDGLDSFAPERAAFEGLTVWRFFPPNLSHLSESTGNNAVTKSLWRGIDIVNLPAARVVGRILDRTDPDVVHTNNLLGLTPSVGRTIQRRDLFHVHTLHDYSLLCPRGTLLRKWTAPEGERTVCHDPPSPCRAYASGRRATLGTPDVVTAPSQHVIDVHREYGFFDGVDCRRLRLGVESVADRPPAIPDEPSILYAGSHQESKGLNALFEAAERLPEVTFHLCGSGPEVERSEEKAAALANLEYHGFVSAAELHQRRRTASAAVVPSIWMENSPFTIYESFAAGLPVIGSDIGGIPELIDPGDNGQLFEPKNVDDLVATIDDMVSDPDRLRRMRENALEWATEHTVEAHVDRLESDVYPPARRNDDAP
jgi:glycosyltransferase involved in cell wall biosynthesis